MRCFICDAGLAEVHYNRECEEFEPCGTCLEVIKDTLEGFIDKPVADEDELGDDRVFEGITLHSGKSYYTPFSDPYEE